jgi:hypothetical protein
MSAQSHKNRTAVIEQVELLARASAQIDYEKNVPNAFVVAELIEQFVTDLYHPKNPDFVEAFNEDELKELAHLFGVVREASERVQQVNVHSVTELQRLPEWRRVMSLAKRIHANFRTT